MELRCLSVNPLSLSNLHAKLVLVHCTYSRNFHGGDDYVFRLARAAIARAG